MTKEELLFAIDVIDNAQQQIWELHHKVKEYNEELGMEVWLQTLQIEHGINRIREHYEENKV